MQNTKKGKEIAATLRQIAVGSPIKRVSCDLALALRAAEWPTQEPATSWDCYDDPPSRKHFLQGATC
jgi:hypothetical protein